jgi:hypothetical protein
MKSWIQLHDLKDAKVLLILPCNAAACVGNYFRAEVYTRKWNTWREADALFQDLREQGRVAFAALDCSTLETRPEDPRGAIVLETEMHRARNPEGEDWGAPSWRWFRPTPAGSWKHLEELTEALVRGGRRVENLGFHQVVALVNPRAYFLALAAAVLECGVIQKWITFRVPAHPRCLIPAVRQIAPLVRVAAGGKRLPGGIYPIPEFLTMMQKEAKLYHHQLPEGWHQFGKLPSSQEVQKRWASLTRSRD